MTLHPYCDKCGWRKGGVDSWNGKACKCGHSEPPLRSFEEERWLWPRYNPPGLLIGPLPHVKTPGGNWAPDWSHPGVVERIRVEVDFIEDQVPKWKRL